ncbi:MAG: hypothetical protein KC731_33110 [Myxococcales bacterium]|nr:hypothetical protein [Myxococcales bacterium]
MRPAGEWDVAWAGRLHHGDIDLGGNILTTQGDQSLGFLSRVSVAGAVEDVRSIPDLVDVSGEHADAPIVTRRVRAADCDTRGDYDYPGAVP